jgi:hypothetical protein
MSYLHVTLYGVEDISDDAIRPYGVCIVPL